MKHAKQVEAQLLDEWLTCWESNGKSISRPPSTATQLGAVAEAATVRERMGHGSLTVSASTPTA
jgi:hypothetical protein